MYGSTFSWSLDRIADLVFNWVSLGAVLWLSAALVIRWIRRGRIEDCSQADLMPTWLRRWTGRGRHDPVISTTTRAPTVEITVWGWLLLGCIAVWVLAKVI